MDDLQAAVDAVADHDGNITAAALALGVKRKTFSDRFHRGVQEGFTPLSFSTEPLPEKMPTTGAMIDHMCERFKRLQAHETAKKWQVVKVREKGPIGICWFGDPHVDDDGCNWPLLKRDAGLVRDTAGMFGANIGDTTNNWVGRLMRLYAKQETSQETARALANWLLVESGVEWILWLMGNHDEWNEGSEILRLMNIGDKVLMRDWAAQIKLVFPNGREARIDARHDFKGNSMWNTLHGAQKTAHMRARADLYIAGHTHNWALHQEESASREFTYWLARCRGYKFIDDFAERLGHAPQQEGASIVTIFDPDATSNSGFLQCFADVEKAADYLTWMRK